MSHCYKGAGTCLEQIPAIVPAIDNPVICRRETDDKGKADQATG